MATYQVRIDADGQKILSDPLSDLGSNLATSELPGAVQPDNVTTRVDNAGVLSAIGGNLLLNSEEWITESCEWTAPVTGWYDVLLIGGGEGGWAYKGTTDLSFCLGGWSGDYKNHYLYLVAGQEVPVTIGTGGIGVAAAFDEAIRLGGRTFFGNLSTSLVSDDWRGFSGDTDRRVWSSTSPVEATGAGFGGGGVTVDTDSGYSTSGVFYGAGAGVAITASGEVHVGNGKQGAVRLRYYDPAKAAGPAE